MTWRDPEGSLGYFGQVFMVRESRWQAARYVKDLAFIKPGRVIGVIQWEQPCAECPDRVHSVVVTTTPCLSCLDGKLSYGVPIKGCQTYRCKGGLVFGDRHVLHKDTLIKRRLHVAWLFSPLTKRDDQLIIGMYITDPRGVMLQVKRKR